MGNLAIEFPPKGRVTYASMPLGVRRPGRRSITAAAATIPAATVATAAVAAAARTGFTAMALNSI